MPSNLDRSKCLICGGSVQVAENFDWPNTFDYPCDRCGRVRITDNALEYLTPEEKPLFSAFFRRIPAGQEVPIVKSDNYSTYLRSLPSYSPSEKMDKLLEVIAQKTEAPGAPSRFRRDIDYPLILARDQQELMYYERELSQQSLIDVTMNGPDTITLLGWKYLEQVRRTGTASNRVFVAMWFDESTHSVYEEAIKTAIQTAGYDPIRIDRTEHVNRIDDEIIGQIKRCRFMVADFTGQRSGVYFEAGMMLGVGRTVIWMCKKPELESIHFNVRQFNFIDYENLEEARTRLHRRILAVEGEGPGPSPRPGMI